MIVQKLEINNFLSIADATIEFPSSGLMLISGWNNTLGRSNGAGKSTLLKLINRDYRLDTGRISLTRDVTSLIRLGTGLQTMLTGRENIYIKCTELGLTQFEIDALYDSMVDFSGLSASIDLPVKQYSDGMYARLEFSIATCVPCDLLLIDEVLSVGDIGFQIHQFPNLAC